MVILAGDNIRTSPIQSSKGNQLKWEQDGVWYKADYTGYEGLAEYMVSELLRYSNLDMENFILYETEEISYNNTVYRGCKSDDFLPQGWQLITLERLFESFYGRSLYKSIYKIQGVENRAYFLVEHVERMTGLKEFGGYLSVLLTIDAVFLNEDRHMHNIAVLRDNSRQYHYCPVFDNGSALLSDLTVDYPLNMDIIDLIPRVQAKTLCSDFQEQLEAVESLYGQTLRFSFDSHVITHLLEKEPYYPEQIKVRVRDILLQQRRTYQYLFQG